MIFERNPNWDGVLRVRINARHRDRKTSHDAAAIGNKNRDLREARGYVDLILERGDGIISNELREYVLEGIAAGRIDSKGHPAHIRADSIRRRFSDLCPPRDNDEDQIPA